jgi:mono/diheme cytochrome c family protein
MNYGAVLLAFGLLSAELFVLAAQQPVPAAVFTAAQADAGRAAFENTCAKCHTTTLLGRKGNGDSAELPPVRSLSAAYQEFIGTRGYVAPLAGKEFLARWGSKTVAELIARFQETVVSFPPEGMTPETTVNITAYILQVNGAPAGSRPLTRNTGVAVGAITR